MLKIWKQAWKKEDGVGQDGGQDSGDTLAGADSVSLSAHGATEGDVQNPVASASDEKDYVKRVHGFPAEQDEPGHDRPSKRIKTNDNRTVNAADNISKRLPEVMELDGHDLVEHDALRFEAVVSSAKQENGPFSFVLPALLGALR